MKKRQKIPAHLKWVTESSCVVCFGRPVQAHHLLRVPVDMQTEERHGHSASKRSHDSWTVPLCGKHHTELHLNGNEEKWAESYGLDLPALADWFWRNSK
jgi:hypothetical protein